MLKLTKQHRQSGSLVHHLPYLSNRSESGGLMWRKLTKEPVYWRVCNENNAGTMTNEDTDIVYTGNAPEE